MVDTQIRVSTPLGGPKRTKPRRTYTRAFKRAAVQLITEQGRSGAQAARRRGASEEQLRPGQAVRREQGQHASPGPGPVPPADAELRRLRRENQRLRGARGSLTKAPAFVAEESL